MKHLNILLVCSVVLISGCTPAPSSEPENTPEEKKPFYISTTTLEDLSENYEIKKSGKILGNQDIIVTSQVSARVEGIRTNIGDTVSKDQTIIDLADSSGSYSFAVQRARAAVEQAQINYDQTMLNLEKSIADTQNALEQAKIQANNAELNSNSTASLQLAQLDEQIANAEYDYQTKVKSDNQTIQNFISSTKKLARDTELLYQDVITETDQILGVTNTYENDNDPFEQLLGAQNTSTKSIATTDLRNVIQAQQKMERSRYPIEMDNLEESISDIQNNIEALSPLLQNMDTMLSNTVTNASFGPSWLAGLRTTVNGLQTQVQGQLSASIQLKNSIDSFLRTYESQQESILNSIDTLRLQRKTQEKTLESAQETSGIGVNSAETSYNTTLKTKQTTEQALRNAITQAQISYNEALNQSAKLTVESPIAGSIGDILVDEGQEVIPGSQLFTVSSIDDQQIEIALTSDELGFVQAGAQVRVINGDQVFSGQIDSVTKTADATLSYKAIISLESSTDLIGTVATIEIPVTTTYPLIPIKHVTILNKTSGSIVLRDGESIEENIVSLGKVRGNMIEVTSALPANGQIVTSDTSNFDSNTFSLVVNNE